MKYNLGDVVEFNVDGGGAKKFCARIGDLCIGEVRSRKKVTVEYEGHFGGSTREHVYYEISGFPEVEESRITQLISNSTGRSREQK